MSDRRFLGNWSAVTCAALWSVVWLAGCASTPPVPEWKLRSSAALDRATQAALAGETRRAQGDFSEAFAQIARSGQPALMARAHLLKCAVQVASLDLAPCTEFEARRIDATAEDRAYANYLQGTLAQKDLGQLPAQHRPFIAPLAATADPVAPANLLSALKGQPDPLTRLVVAGVLFRSGRASPDIIGVAVQTASAQGWRAPLATWLKTQIQVAQKTGDTALAQSAQRRLNLVLGQ